MATLINLLHPEYPCFMYQAGRSEEKRREARDEWEETRGGKQNVMVATSAFGCGIDVATVRCVIHARAPQTLLDFIQESGRAGRDGSTADSVVLNVNGGDRTARILDLDVDEMGEPPQTAAVFLVRRCV